MKRRPRLPQRLLKEITTEQRKTERARNGKLKGSVSKRMRKEQRKLLRLQKKRKRSAHITDLTADKIANPPQKEPSKIETENCLKDEEVSVDCPADNVEEGEVQGKYIPPFLRGGKKELSQDQEGLQRKLRGLLNRLTEDNIKGIVDEVVAVYTTQSRHLLSSCLAAELLKVISEGPRATDQFTGIAAAFISAVCVSTGSHDIITMFLPQLASNLESACQQEDSLGALNLIGSLCHVYLCGLVASGLVYGVLSQLTQHMTDLDIALLHRILEICGLRLRSDDPESMKGFVLKVHNRAAALAQEGKLTHRAELMLDLVIDIKNNKLSKTGKRETFRRLSPAVSRWMQQLDVQKMALVELTWDQITAPNKTGRWWLPDPQRQETGVQTSLTELNSQQENGIELLSLANQQRMNTDLRKSVFCIIMGSVDSIDACEKLTRLPLKGEQDREIIRVLVECCLQEKKWNGYYSLLAWRLCKAKSSHGTTLKFCLKDKLKIIEEMEIRQLNHLAKLTAELIQKDILSLGLIKSLDLSSGMTQKSLFFWRIFFVRLLLSFNSLEQCTAQFSRLSTSSESLQLLGKRLLVFLQLHFESWIVQLDTEKTKWLSLEQLKLILERYYKLHCLLKSIP